MNFSKKYKNFYVFLPIFKDQSRRRMRENSYSYSPPNFSSSEKNENTSSECTTNPSECKICYNLTDSNWILDCGHVPFCDICVVRLFDSEEPKCPICRSKIKSRRRAYL